MLPNRKVAKRLARLEQTYFGGGGSRPPRDGRAMEFARASLRAMAHVKRQPIDEKPWRYETESLYHMEPERLAAYATGLALVGHEDADIAKELLLSVGLDEELQRTMNAVLSRFLRESFS